MPQSKTFAEEVRNAGQLLSYVMSNPSMPKHETSRHVSVIFHRINAALISETGHGLHWDRQLPMADRPTEEIKP